MRFGSSYSSKWGRTSDYKAGICGDGSKIRHGGGTESHSEGGRSGRSTSGSHSNDRGHVVHGARRGSGTDETHGGRNSYTRGVWGYRRRPRSTYSTRSRFRGCPTILRGGFVLSYARRSGTYVGNDREQTHYSRCQKGKEAWTATSGTTCAKARGPPPS